MSTYILGSDGCSHCQDCVANDPCSAGCECDFDTGLVGGEPVFDDSYDVTGQFTIAGELGISVAFGDSLGVGETARFRVYANGTLVYDSGCQNSWVDGDSAAIPAGTTVIRAEMVFCSGSGNISWEYHLQCL